MKAENKKSFINITLAGMFLAIGLLLPFLTGQIKQIGSMLLPMHIPVILCGLICGWKYGFAIGLIMPPLRYLLFSMPQIYPTGIAMALELAAYGAVVGLLYSRSKWHCIASLYRSMLIAMVAGRIVWGAVMTIILGFGGFTWEMFMAGAFLNAIPGIILQLVFIPVVMIVLNKTGFVKFSNNKEKSVEISK